MALSYAGVGLNLLTEEYAAFVDQYHSFTDFSEADLWGYAGYGIDHLPIPSVPLTEQPRVGVVVWPTGLCRCSYGHFLVSDTRLAAIRTAIGDDSGPADLVLTGAETVTLSMYLIAARPLAQISGSEGVSLITLCDRRWFDRTRTGSITSTPSTWASLFSQLASQLGITLSVDTVPSGYGTPTDRWVVKDKPLCVLLDAAASQVGLRIRANWDGTFSAVNPATASAAVASLEAAYTRKTAGGLWVQSDRTRQAPAEVKVVFRQALGSGSGDTTNYSVTKTLSGLALSGYAGSTGTSGTQVTHFAELVYTGTNSTVCNNYATQAATDFYNWRLFGTDLTLPQIAEWEPTGAEDRIEFKYEVDKVLTRVLRLPLQSLSWGGFVEAEEGCEDYRTRCVSGALIREKCVGGQWGFDELLGVCGPAQTFGGSGPRSGSGYSGSGGAPLPDDRAGASPVRLNPVTQVCADCGDVIEVSADYTATEAIWMILVDTTGGAVTVTLPAWFACGTYWVQKVDSGGNSVTVEGTGSDTVNGGTISFSTQWAGARIDAGLQTGKWYALKSA